MHDTVQIQLPTVEAGITGTKQALAEARIHVAEAEEMLRPKREQLALEIKVLEESFRAENKELLEAKEQLEANMKDAEETLRGALVVWYEATGLKTFDANLSVRVTERLEYENDEAVSWAKVNAPFMLHTTVDKKAFEMVAKDQGMPFVKVHKTPTAVSKGL